MSGKPRPCSEKNTGVCQTKILRGRPWKGAEKLTARLTVRLSYSELHSLKRLSKECGMSPSEFVRCLIRIAMEVSA